VTTTLISYRRRGCLSGARCCALEQHLIMTSHPSRDHASFWGGFFVAPASSIFSRDQIRANVWDAASPKAPCFTPYFCLAPLLARARPTIPPGRVSIKPFAATDSGLSFLHRWRKRGRRRRVSPLPSSPPSRLWSSCQNHERICRVRRRRPRWLSRLDRQHFLTASAIRA
jgi:hypothetical protein